MNKEDIFKDAECCGGHTQEKLDNGQCCQQKKTKSKEIGGTDGPEPTRFGDWEKQGITTDF